jgi:hypothetical protein
VGTLGKYHDIMVVICKKVEGYGLSNRICIWGGGFFRKYLIETPKGGKDTLKTYAIP